MRTSVWIPKVGWQRWKPALAGLAKMAGVRWRLIKENWHPRWSPHISMGAKAHKLMCLHHIPHKKKVTRYILYPKGPMTIRTTWGWTTTPPQELQTQPPTRFVTSWKDRTKESCLYGENSGLSGQQLLPHPSRPVSLRCFQRDPWKARKDRDLEKTGTGGKG